MHSVSETLRKSSLLLVAIAIAAVAAALMAASAQASTTAIIKDCVADGSIDGNYSTADLKKAQKNMPSDVNEYYQCGALIDDKLLAATTKKKGKSAKDTAEDAALIASLASPKQKQKAAREVAEATELPSKGPIANVAGVDVERSGPRTLASSAAPGVPLALIIALLGFLLLITSELAGRRANMTRMRKVLPKFARNKH